MNKQQELSQKLNELTKNIIGAELERAFVLIGTGYFANIYSKSSAIEILNIWKQIPDFTKFSIESKFEDIDIFDDDGELVDIQDGEFLYYQITATI